MQMRDFLERTVDAVGTAALLLSVTNTISDEEYIKQFLQEKGYKVAVTELGGRSSVSDFQERSTRSVIGACLNCNIIKKEAYEIHALLHAAEEAKKGVIVNVSSSTDLSLKVAIARKDRWIAVAMYGYSAVHHTSNHQRSGLGVMHI